MYARAAALILAILLFDMTAHAQELPRRAFGAKLGITMESEARYEHGGRIDTEKSPMLFAYWDFAIMKYFRFGAFLQGTFLSLDESSTDIVHVGLGIQPKLGVDFGKVQARLCARLGANLFLPDDDHIDTIKGLYTGPAVEFLYELNHSLGLTADFGFFGQLVGGTDNEDVTVEPTFYFSIGIETLSGK